MAKSACVRHAESPSLGAGRFTHASFVSCAPCLPAVCKGSGVEGWLGMPVRAITKIAATVLALLLLAVVWVFTPISRFANPDAVAAAIAAMSASPWRVLIVLGCYLGAGLVIFPMALLVVGCAVVFGPAWGMAYSAAGLLASAALNYGIGAWLGREAVQNTLGRRFSAARSALLRRGLITIAMVRAIPMSPFALVSVAAGASHIRFFDYLVGTAIGIVVPVVLLSVATEQTSRMIAEPSVLHFAFLAGVIVLWIAVAFAAQAVLERIAKGQTRDAP
jgi:phospholipase D1/2